LAVASRKPDVDDKISRALLVDAIEQGHHGVCMTDRPGDGFSLYLFERFSNELAKRIVCVANEVFRAFRSAPLVTEIPRPVDAGAAP
jgi:hypothetical protein